MTNHPNNITSSFSTAIVLACSLFLTFCLHQEAREIAKTDLENQFNTSSKEIHLKLQQNITYYEEVMLGAKGLFSASQIVNRKEFRLYADQLSIQQRFKGMQGLGFSQLIPSAQLASHIAAVKAEGFPDYKLRPSGIRDLYSSIIFLEPFTAENQRAFGYDMYAEDIRRTAMNKSRDSGEPTITDKISLVQFSGEKESAGFLMYLPVYANNLPHQTLLDRQTNIKGWVYAPIRMQTFIESLKFQNGNELDINIGDIDASGNIKPLFGMFKNRSETNSISSTTVMNILGRNWRVDIYPTTLFFKKNYDSRPNLILITGLCLSFLLSILIWLLGNGRARAIQLAESITEDLRESEFRWKFALEGAGDGVWDWNCETGDVHFSTYWKSMLGYSDNEIKNNFLEWERLLHPEDRERATQSIRNYVKGVDDNYAQEIRMLHKNGQWLWILTRGMIVASNEKGAPKRIIGTHTDITRQKQLELQIFESESRFRLSFDNAPIGMGLVDLNGKWIKVNKAICQMLGMSEPEMISCTFQDITHPDDLKTDLENLERLFQGTIENYQMEKRYIHKKGHNIWINLSVSLVRDDHGNPVHYVAHIEDINERKIKETEIKHLAYHDTLTDLPNRRVILDRLKQAMFRAQREKKMIGVYFIDIDHFKKINDTHGHGVGDQILQATANNLKQCIRKVDTLGRQSGDEFIIVSSTIDNRTDLTAIAKKIIKAFETPFEINGEKLQVSLSIGISAYEFDSVDTLEELMKKADIALYEAKGAGRNGFRLYTDNAI